MASESKDKVQNELDISNKVSELNITSSSKVTNDNPEMKAAMYASPKSEGSSEDEQLTIAEKSLLQKVVRKGLIESKYDIEIQRKDPTSPLYSVKTFEALHLKAELLKGLYEMGYNAPSKIQETALPTLLADPPQNMIAQSQSGTGKTAAFVIAMLSRVDATKNYPQVLCLSPTYELAIQTGDVAIKMSQFCKDIKIRYAIRGEQVARNTKLSEQIIIGTPGKVVDWAIKYRIFDLAKIRVFVLDEADVMIATQGHQDQSFRIRKLLSSECQMMFFSATYDEDVMDYAEAIVPNPVTIRLKREEESLDNIKQYYVMCHSPEEKYQAISNIYGVVTIGQAMIFCHTRKMAAWLAQKMSQDGHAVALLSGELTVDQRIAVLDRFREGKEKVLITTNVLSRGIDIEQVTIVVNFDLPIDVNRQADCETYLHRIGRTGRFGKVGLAINLIDSQEALNILCDVERHFGRKITLLDAEDMDELRN
uniref:RNA helicase n=2 Tax=Clastoptera arizonana TaxID=38151 RepID=A0A1B6CZZ3_9HEMI